jgi:hypothetical protein
MTAAGGVVIAKEGGGTLSVKNVRADGLAVNGGTLIVLNNGGPDGVSVVRSLTIAGLPGAYTGLLDVGNNALVVDYAEGERPIDDVRTQISSGYGAGTWAGTGITSSAAASNPALAVGYAESSAVLGPSGGTFVGQNVDGTAVLVRTTLSGDANLDGAVDFNDLAALAQNYNNIDGQRMWWQGDFNYDGGVDFNDLAAMAQNYNTSLPSGPIAGAPDGFEEDLTRALASVPEPSMSIPLALLALHIIRPRKRRKPL